MTYALIYFAIGIPIGYWVTKLAIKHKKWVTKMDAEAGVTIERVEENPAGVAMTTLLFSFIWPFLLVGLLCCIRVRVSIEGGDTDE